MDPKIRKKRRKMEYELIYGIKQREEDILADTWSVPFQPIKKFGKVKENEWHQVRNLELRKKNLIIF